MTRPVNNSIGRQDGAILIISMVILIAITLLTVSSMRSSNIGLRMAQNEESRIAAEQGAQALADAIVSDPKTTPVIGGSGFTICTAGESGCNRYDLPIANSTMAYDISTGNLTARVQRIGPVFRPPPRVVESSIDKFSSATFEVTATYDRADESLGRQRIVEGVMVLVPTVH
jgi:hypothetical protein